jgi:two-component system response regulator HydG
LVAEALHRFSRRAEQVFVKVSCTTIPDNLLEAELFGYEKGAFTGAVQRKEGRFELADRGTIFLDEIGELPLNLQSKLLRILQEGAFERLGSNKTQRVNVRVVAATNRDLRLEVKEQRFREDLFFRLQVIELKLPPLRARQEDIPLLIEHFIKLYSAKNNKFVHGIADDALQELQKQPWPGNIRQLENAIERAIIFAKGEVIQKNDLPNLYNEELTKSGSITIPLGTSMSDIEKVVIEETLRLTGGDKNKAAALLGIAARTIYRKIDP